MRIYLRRTPEGILAIKRLLATICVIAALAMNVVASVAEARGFIRDAEIEATLKRIARPVLAAAGLNAASIRIIIVNDGSSDDTSKVIQDLATKDARIAGIDHEKNQGVGAARGSETTPCVLRAATADRSRMSPSPFRCPASFRGG